MFSGDLDTEWPASLPSADVEPAGNALEDWDRGFEGILCESSGLGDLYKGWIYKTRPEDSRKETECMLLRLLGSVMSVKSWPRFLGSETRAPGPRRGEGGVPAEWRAEWL